MPRQYWLIGFTLVFSPISIASENSLGRTMVVTYSSPPGEHLSDDYHVFVNGHFSPTYVARTLDHPFDNQSLNYGGPYCFSNFDLNGPVEIRVTSSHSLLNAVIRPITSGLSTQLQSNNTLLIHLQGPCTFCLEPNGKNNPLLIFANPLEQDPPNHESENVVYFGPGIHHAGKIELKSDQILYIAGGAIVKGGVMASGKHIRIRGHGILDASDYEWRKGPTRDEISIYGTEVDIDGITIRGSSQWTIALHDSSHVTLSNVKICGARVQNDDGVDICNSQDVKISGCFIRTDDDCLAVKGLASSLSKQNCTNISIDSCILWSDRARVCLLGHESDAKSMKAITLSNLEIIHFALPAFLFQPNDGMSLEQVAVDNVQINGEGQEELVRIETTPYQTGSKVTSGNVFGIHFRNVSLYGKLGAYRCFLFGNDHEHSVSDVTLENFYILGTPVLPQSKRVEIAGSVEGYRAFITTLPH